MTDIEPPKYKNNSLNPAGIKNKDGVNEHETDYSLFDLSKLDEETAERILELNKLLQFYSINGEYLKAISVKNELERLEEKHDLKVKQGE